MKQMSAFMKSPVGRFHSSFAVFILFNLLSGLIGRTGYFPVLGTIHFISGLLIVVSPAVFLLMSKNRGMILKAFGKMALFQKNDFTRRKALPVLFKATVVAIAASALCNAVTGMLYRFGAVPVPACSVHIVLFYVTLAAVPLHVLFGLMLHRKPKR